jgi:hypothetical protein
MVNLPNRGRPDEDGWGLLDFFSIQQLKNIGRSLRKLGKSW